MTNERLAAHRRELLEEIERSVASRDVAQNALLGEQLALWAARTDEVTAAPLCFAFAKALGLSPEEAKQFSVMVGFVELAALSLRELSGGQDAPAADLARRYGLPLILNSCDGLYSLAHVALAEFEGDEGGRRQGVAARFDALTLTLCEKALSPVEGACFGDWPAVKGAAGRLAGELQAQAAGRPAPTVLALGKIGEALARQAAGGRSASPAEWLALLAGADLSATERASLEALLKRNSEV